MLTQSRLSIRLWFLMPNIIINNNYNYLFTLPPTPAIDKSTSISHITNASGQAITTCHMRYYQCSLIIILSWSHCHPSLSILIHRPQCHQSKYFTICVQPRRSSALNIFCKNFWLFRGVQRCYSKSYPAHLCRLSYPCSWQLSSCVLITTLMKMY